MAGVQWARQILDDDARRSEIDHLGEPWALTLPPIPMEDGEIRGAIVDAQGRLNVNALGAADASADQERARLARLFAQRGMPPAALAAMADWIDADGAAGEAGAEDAFYLAQPVPRLAANAPVLRVAELGVVKGVTPRLLESVLPFLSALPAGTPRQRQHRAARGARRHRRKLRRGRASRRWSPTEPASRSRPSPSSGRACPTARRSRATSRCRSGATTST